MRKLDIDDAEQFFKYTKKNHFKKLNFILGEVELNKVIILKKNSEGGYLLPVKCNQYSGGCTTYQAFL